MYRMLIRNEGNLILNSLFYIFFLTENGEHTSIGKNSTRSRTLDMDIIGFACNLERKRATFSEAASGGKKIFQICRHATLLHMINVMGQNHRIRLFTSSRWKILWMGHWMGLMPQYSCMGRRGVGKRTRCWDRQKMQGSCLKALKIYLRW